MEELDTLQKAPLHRFPAAHHFHFKFISLTGDNFREVDVAHRHAYWTLFVFLKGGGKHLIDFEEVDIKPGTIHFVLPGQIHALNGSKHIQAYAIMFTEEFFLMDDEMKTLLMKLFGFMDAGKPVVLQIPKDVRAYYEQTLALMKKEYDGRLKHSDKVLLNFLSILIHKCMQILALPVASSATQEAALYIRFRTEVEKHFRKEHSVTFYAGSLNTNTKILNGLTSAFSGKTALEFIHERILIEAKRMLRYTPKPIKEIAYTLHFTDAAHFANFFKQKTGTTPLEYKQEM